jgi:hypothetical protein
MNGFFFFSLSWKAHDEFTIVSTHYLWNGFGYGCMVQCIFVGRKKEASSQKWVEPKWSM